MSDHISTEEAERIAERIWCYHGRGCHCDNSKAAAALHALAAERDRLGNEVEHHVEELDLRMKAIREQEKRMAALAAERDALIGALGEALDTSSGCPIEPPCGNCKFCRAFNVYAAALGENQP